MKHIFKSNKPFIIPYLLFLLLGAALIILTQKSSLHIHINKYHYSLFDAFFYYITHLGDGLFMLFIAFIMLFIKFRYSLLFGISYALSSAVAQFLKRIIFPDQVRPKKFFEHLYEIYLVPGVDNHLYNSFPSGHAVTAFSLFFMAALLVKDKTLKFLFFCIALLSAFSRVYLSQHFFEDIYAGSIIGSGVSLFVYAIFANSKKAFMDKSLLTLLNNKKFE